MRQVGARVFAVGFVALATVGGCVAPSGGDDDEREAAEKVARVASGQIIGTNDFVVVTGDGANVPAKYRPTLDAFGALSVGCTATHVGGGVAVTAGHCFGLGARVNDRACSGSVSWGLRADKAAYLKSTCTTILAGEVQGDRDWAIFRVSPVPPVAVGVDLGGRKRAGTKLTIFGHPQLRPLEWSKTCSLITTGSGPSFNHECDTEPGNSGSSILDDDTLMVVGIHDGATGSQNYATFIADTPIAQYVTARDAGAGGQDAGGGAADAGGGAADAGGGAADAGGGTACAASEREPNDQYTSPNAINGKLCGALATGSDEDWFTWSVGTTPTRYDITLAATGDAQIQMWKLVSGQYYQVANTTTTSFTNKTSNGAGSYVIAVWSASGTAQSYTLTLAK
jgi:hypothetical protein